MRKTFAALLALGFLAACSGGRKTDSSNSVVKNPPAGAAAATPPAFALPGVPLKNEPLPELSEAKKPEAAPAPAAEAKPGENRPEEAKTVVPGPDEEKPAEANAAEPKPAEAKPAEAAPEPSGDLKYHLDAARKYFSGRKYRSAAAEYEAAMAYLPAGDARAVHLLERQGAMMLKIGKDAKAREQFLSAIGKAKELNTAGDDLANSYLGLGYCQEKAKQAADAISSYEKALELSTSRTVKDKLSNTISELKKTAK